MSVSSPHPGPIHAVFFGPPGAGKGTQAQILAARHRLPVMDMGATIRQAIRESTAAGLKAKSFVEAGRLVPSDVVIEMALERLGTEAFSGSWLLDGFPRNLAQAEALEAYLHGAGDAGRLVVVNFGADPETLVARLSNRLICPKCATVFNLRTNPPPVADTCAECGAQGLSRRADDEPEVIRNRLAVYQEETHPLLEYYTTQGRLREVDALQEIEAVTAAVEAALGLAPSPNDAQPPA